MLFISGCEKREDIYALIQKDDVIAVKELLPRENHTDVGQNEYVSPLFYSIMLQRTKITELLLRNGENINVEDIHGWSPLYYAVYNNYPLSMVVLLINNGADVNHETRYGDTPLHAASKNGNVDIVKLLIDRDANIDTQDDNGCTPLHLASQEGHLEVVKYLIQQGANIWIQDHLTAWSYDYAVGRHDTDIVKLLLSETNMTEVDDEGHTIFHRACMRGDMQLIKMLFDLYPDLEINQKDLQGSTPLDLAIRYNPDGKELHEFLKQHGGEATEKTYLEKKKEEYPEELFVADLKAKVKSGVDLNYQDRNGRTLLHKAAELGYLQGIKLLLSQNIDVNLQDKGGMTALNLSMMMKHYRISAKLIDYGANLNIVDELGMSPLCYATASEDRENKYNLMKLLIEKSADINGNTKSESPLFLSISTKDTEALNILINNGADIEHFNRFGDTPLIQAIQSQNIKAFEVLLKHGASLKKNNQEGHTPLNYLDRMENSIREQYMDIISNHLEQ